MNGKKCVHDYYSSWAQGNSLYMKWAAVHEIGYPELMVLYALHMKGSVTQMKICDSYGFPKQTVNSVIRSFKAQGYIALTVNPSDKREKLVTLTDGGKAHSEKALGPLLEVEERVCKRIGERKLCQMIETMELFNLLFRKEMEREC